jgi:hypothetical protein
MDMTLAETSTISIPPLPTAFLDRVRFHGADDQNHPVRRLRAEGGEPCRDVLRRARPGEELILASFSPFTIPGPYKEFGPVFVLAVASDEPVRRDVLPIEGRDRYLRDQFVIRAYSKHEEIVDAALVTPATADERLRALLDVDDVAFLHVRFPTYGCFACRIDRA